MAQSAPPLTKIPTKSPQLARGMAARPAARPKDGRPAGHARACSRLVSSRLVTRWVSRSRDSSRHQPAGDRRLRRGQWRAKLVAHQCEQYRPHPVGLRDAPGCVGRLAGRLMRRWALSTRRRSGPARRLPVYRRGGRKLGYCVVRR